MNRLEEDPVQTLIKILEKIGENMAWAGWMYGTQVYPRPPYYPHPRKDDR
jgi:hypothetical protein